MIKTRLVKLLSHTKKYIVQMVLWQWIALLGQIAAIFSIGRMVDCILMHQMSDQVILTTFMVLVVAVVIRFLCDQMATRASFAASVDVKRILREKIYDKLLRLGASYRRCGTAGDLFWKISSAVVLQHFSACDIIYHFVFYQFKGKCDIADLRSIDSDFNRCCAEARKEAIK